MLRGHATHITSTRVAWPLCPRHGTSGHGFSWLGRSGSRIAGTSAPLVSALRWVRRGKAQLASVLAPARAVAGSRLPFFLAAGKSLARSGLGLSSSVARHGRSSPGFGLAWHGESGLGWAWHGFPSLGVASLPLVWLGGSRCGSAWQGWAGSRRGFPFLL